MLEIKAVRKCQNKESVCFSFVIQHMSYAVTLVVCYEYDR